MGGSEVVSYGNSLVKSPGEYEYPPVRESGILTPMQTLVLLFVALTSLVLLGGAVVAFFSLRRAPEGMEDENGFHVTGVAASGSPSHASGSMVIES